MNLNYHIYESSIKCPYCDNDYSDDDYMVSQNLEAKIELECDSCGKKFWAEAFIVFSSHADCELNNEKHILEATHIPNFFGCKNCPQHGYKKEEFLSEE